MTTLLLEAAQGLARKLCENAIWNRTERSCSWRGEVAEFLPSGISLTTTQPIGGSLYQGSCGIALFLVELRRIAQQPDLDLVIAGALHEATALATAAKRGAANALLPFYEAAGIVYVIDRSRTVFGDSFFKSERAELLEMIRNADAPRYLDFLGGAAGAVCFLLKLRDEPWARERAVALGEEICAAADWSDDGCSWDARHASGFDCPPLAGLSHGASGIALALVRLFAATNRNEFLITARGACAYEDTLFDPAQKNWLDLRFVDSRDEALAAGDSIIAWCHGAPGIALARMVASAIDKERAAEHLAAIRIAAATTKAALADGLARPCSDVTLCHGLLGLAEILNLVHAGIDDPSLAAFTRAACQELCARYMTTGDWPCGVVGGTASPSLMVGDAGVGHALLRLAHPHDVPPILLF